MMQHVQCLLLRPVMPLQYIADQEHTQGAQAARRKDQYVASLPIPLELPCTEALRY